MRKGLVPFTTARPVNIVQSRPMVNSAKQMSNTFNKAHAFVKRPINKRTGRPRAAVNAARRKAAVNAARPKVAVNVARPRVVVNTTRPKAVLKAAKGNMVNVVKASACWRTNPILLTLKKLMEDLLPLVVTPEEGRLQGKEFLRTKTPLFKTMLIQKQAEVGEGSGHPTEPQHTSTTASPTQVEPIIVPSSSQPKNTYKHEAVTKEWEDKMERAATTASSLEAEQDSGNINRTQSMATLNEPSP
ncbi:hypothetical protein Tco_1526350 [Tanacetum coccineum]